MRIIGSLGILNSRPRCDKSNVPEDLSIHTITVEIRSSTEREEKDRVEHLKTALRQIQHEKVKLFWEGKEL